MISAAFNLRHNLSINFSHTLVNRLNLLIAYYYLQQFS